MPAMGKINFVAMLWLMGLAGLFLGSTTLFVKLRFEMGERSAVMTSVDPTIARALKYNPGDYVLADVVYEAREGNVAVTTMVVRPQDLPTLAAGKGVPIRFRSGNPREVLYAFEDKPWGFGWVILGIAGTALGFYAHRALRRETD
jgi:hypothetical protein